MHRYSCEHHKPWLHHRRFSKGGRILAPIEQILTSKKTYPKNL